MVSGFAKGKQQSLVQFWCRQKPSTGFMHLIAMLFPFSEQPVMPYLSCILTQLHKLCENWQG